MVREFSAFTSHPSRGAQSLTHRFDTGTKRCRKSHIHWTAAKGEGAWFSNFFGGRDSFDPPPGQRAVPTNGWKAVDELELIMRRWRATLDHSKKSEVTLGKR